MSNERFSDEKRLQVSLNNEDLRGFLQCTQGVVANAVFPLIVVSGAVAMALPLPSKGSNRILIRSLYGVGTYILGLLPVKIYAANKCFPEIRKVVEKKTEQQLIQDLNNAAVNSNIQETPDSKPVVSSDVDIPPPSSFSIDYGFSTVASAYKKDEGETNRDNEIKPVTYNELRMRSRAEYQDRLSKYVPEGQASQRTDDESSSSSERPRKKNIYGDFIE